MTQRRVQEMERQLEAAHQQIREMGGQLAQQQGTSARMPEQQLEPSTRSWSWQQMQELERKKTRAQLCMKRLELELAKETQAQTQRHIKRLALELAEQRRIQVPAQQYMEQQAQQRAALAQVQQYME